VSDCENWLDYEGDLNCMMIAMKKKKTMTLREIADRLGLSFVRVKQIQDKAIKKIVNNCPDFKELLEHYYDCDEAKARFLKEHTKI
jgi:DNA-directed RNA polymerase sigma subunit (sigma70/sigma32)